MSDQRPDLSVIVVTFNGSEMALRTLRSASANAGAATIEWHVVDSGSTDGVADAIEREFPAISVTRSTNNGFAAGNNVALPAAHGRYILLLNPDVEILRGTLGDLVAALDERPHVGAASVVQCDPDGTVQPSIRRYPSPLRKLGESLRLCNLRAFETLQESDVCPEHYERESPADWLVGAFLVVRREAAEAVGPLDERFFLYSEEKDWCYRIGNKGWAVRHLPVMAVIHHSGGYPDARRRAQLSHSNILFARKHGSRGELLGTRAAIAIGHLVRAAILLPGVLVRPRLKTRLKGETLALAVTLGAAKPPLSRGSTAPSEQAGSTAA